MEEIKQAIRLIFKEEIESIRNEFSVLLTENTTPLKKFLNVEETAIHLNLAKQTVYGKVNRGELPFHKNGKLYFIREELDAYMAGTWKPSVNTKK